MHQQQQEIKHKENNKIYNSLVPREISKYKEIMGHNFTISPNYLRKNV